MTGAQVVTRFEATHPIDAVAAMVECKVGLKHLDSGAYRHVYRVENLPLVVKFPYGGDDGLEHSRHEINAVRRIQRFNKYRSLRKYVPEMYYMNRATGVVLMREYRASSMDTNCDVEVCNEIGEEFSRVFKIEDWDYHVWNFARNDDGRIVCLDFGFLYSGSS